MTIPPAPWTIFAADTDCAGNAPTPEGVQAGTLNRTRQRNVSADRIRKSMSSARCIPLIGSARAVLDDIGDISVPVAKDEQISVVRCKFQDVFSQNRRPICLGGDHLIKYAGITAAAGHFRNVAILYVDAHPDTAPHSEITYDSVLHHCLAQHPTLTSRSVLIGLRQSTSDESINLGLHGPHIVLGTEFSNQPAVQIGTRLIGNLSGCEAAYLSIDPDGIDPVEAWAVEQRYPGGPRIDQLLTVLQVVSREIPIVGIDVSEHIPELDYSGMTALVLAKLLIEVTSL